MNFGAPPFTSSHETISREEDPPTVSSPPTAIFASAAA